MSNELERAALDGVLRGKCVTDAAADAAIAGVIAAGFHPHPTPDVDVLAEVRALLPTDTKRADDYGRLVRAIRAILDREAGR